MAGRRGAVDTHAGHGTREHERAGGRSPRPPPTPRPRSCGQPHTAGQLGGPSGKGGRRPQKLSWRWPSAARPSSTASAAGASASRPTQLAAIIANNGLPRGGNTSPGGTFAYGDYTGYTKIWDGKTLNGWHGETDALARSPTTAIQMDTARKPGQHHIHFTGLPGVSPILKDFDFKVEFKASAGNFNGGVQYRSRLLTARSANGQPRGIFDPATIANPLGTPLPAGITTQPAAQRGWHRRRQPVASERLSVRHHGQ